MTDADIRAEGHAAFEACCLEGNYDGASDCALETMRALFLARAKDNLAAAENAAFDGATVDIAAYEAEVARFS